MGRLPIDKIPGMDEAPEADKLEKIPGMDEQDAGELAKDLEKILEGLGDVRGAWEKIREDGDADEDERAIPRFSDKQIAKANKLALDSLAAQGYAVSQFPFFLRLMRDERQKNEGAFEFYSRRSVTPADIRDAEEEAKKKKYVVPGGGKFDDREYAERVRKPLATLNPGG